MTARQSLPGDVVDSDRFKTLTSFEYEVNHAAPNDIGIAPDGSLLVAIPADYPAEPGVGAMSRRYTLAGDVVAEASYPEYRILWIQSRTQDGWLNLALESSFPYRVKLSRSTDLILATGKAVRTFSADGALRWTHDSPWLASEPSWRLAISDNGSVQQVQQGGNGTLTVTGVNADGTAARDRSLPTDNPDHVLYSGERLLMLSDGAVSELEDDGTLVSGPAPFDELGWFATASSGDKLAVLNSKPGSGQFGLRGNISVVEMP